jgi:hypothetical protein
VFGFIQGCGSKKECLTPKKDCKNIYIFKFHIVWYILTMVYYCVPTIKVLRRQVNYWMLYKSGFESLTNLQSIVHIIIFYKECKRNSSNDTIDFKKIIKKTHDSLYAITCSLGQFDEKKSYVSKF